ncbi:hypothetical protein Q1695_009370 [Nippostrongylus brasiliensis]|nr:hypothetical protein Q1695_009370 [Nippostrongylus brasiliensis]
MAEEYDDDFQYNSDSGSELGDEAVSEDDGIAMEQEDTSREVLKETPNLEAKVMTVDDLAREMNEIIDEVSAILRIGRGHCRILLHKFNWNKESLLERYYENPDTDAFLRKAQVLPRTPAPPPLSSVGDCEICCNTAPLGGLDCHHRACSTCWQMYLNTKIMDDATSEIQCIFNGCQLLIQDEKVMQYIQSEAVISAYQRLKINSFVEGNRLLKWCPGLDCGKALKVGYSEPRPVVCSCTMRFCFGCAHEWHEPVNCRLLKLWLKKCSDDSETSNWINANTKECPKCQVTIEKDGGCNHMVCKNTSCRMEFCWICLGPWEPHGSSWYNCNRYDDSRAKQARDAQELSRANLQRYLHYYNRFMNHQQSLKLENKLYATVKGKMEQMQLQSMSWIEVQFLRKAVDVLSECRRTLMYTYAFAYYLRRDNHAEIFEGNQRDLEMATEQLSHFLERDLENENLVTLKQKVQDNYRYVDQRRLVLLKHCQEVIMVIFKSIRLGCELVG